MFFDLNDTWGYNMLPMNPISTNHRAEVLKPGLSRVSGYMYCMYCTALRQTKSQRPLQDQEEMGRNSRTAPGPSTRGATRILGT